MSAAAETSADIYRDGGFPRFVRSQEAFWNPAGRLGTFLPGGSVKTANHPFFQSLGTNGRSCATCHQPPSAFGLSLRNVRARFGATHATDPLFAPIDGANCPTAVPQGIPSPTTANGWVPGARDALRSAYSLILSRATIRIALAWPPREADGSPKPVDFTLTIEPADDAPGCNVDATYGLAAGRVSVYRRPPSAAQMNLKTLRADVSSPVLPGSLMWDGRAPSLEQQAIDATRDHAQSTQDPTPEQIAQIVSFQSGIFAAQLVDGEVGRLDWNDGRGGPINLSREIPARAVGDTFGEYSRWRGRGGKFASIARGQAIFNRRTFAVSGVDGFNDLPDVGDPNGFTTCATCHNIAASGADALANSQLGIGVGGSAFALTAPAPAVDLPRFTVTCAPDAVAGFQGRGPIVTNDPGLALITGRCADIGKFTVPQLRGLAARAPYFHDGSAEDLGGVVDFYNDRFAIDLTEREREDLIAFLSAL